MGKGADVLTLFCLPDRAGPAGDVIDVDGGDEGADYKDGRDGGVGAAPPVNRDAGAAGDDAAYADEDEHDQVWRGFGRDGACRDQCPVNERRAIAGVGVGRRGVRQDTQVDSRSTACCPDRLLLSVRKHVTRVDCAAEN